jgi:glycosyltransferase involved in cell wall biosynthesis
MPRPYPMFYYEKAKWWQKPIYHLLDHFDPRNRRIMRRVLEAFNPEQVNVHVIQGLGYNALREIGRRNVPVTFFLHDLALACYRMGMFRNGRNCAGQCRGCKVSSRWKERCLKSIRNLGFISPSRANLDILSRFFPVKTWPHAAIMNVNKYPEPTVAREESPAPRLLYVGRMHANKGVRLLLEAAERLSARHRFTLTLVGAGPEEAELREKYGSKDWCKFTGFISQPEISNLMRNSDVLCIPSIWAENSPGVVIHALGLGLPVVGSDNAGIPELVEHEKNGLLVPPGDLAAWTAALDGILTDPARLAPWRAYALENAYRFDQDFLGGEMVKFIFWEQSAAAA